MIVPAPAPVKPRAISPQTGEVLPLEDEIQLWIDSGKRGRFRIVGSPGSGKTTALCHLAAVLPQSAAVSFWDDVDDQEPVHPLPHVLVIYAGKALAAPPGVIDYPLASWEDDEAIDYLLAVHKDRCASVLIRLRDAPDKSLLNGTPELWRVVLDELAADESVTEVRTAFLRFIERWASDERLQGLIRAGCLDLIAFRDKPQAQVLASLKQQGCPDKAVRVLRHWTVQLVLAAQQVAADLHTGSSFDYFAARLPLALVRMAAEIVPRDFVGLGRLHCLLTDLPWKQPMAASILHATNTGWKPNPGQMPLLSKSYLAGADWPEIDITNADLSEADLSGANLAGAVLDRVKAGKANFSGACLRGASLHSFEGSEARLSRADLSSVCGMRVFFGLADLKEANLQSASLKKAILMGANLTRANFQSADLTGALVSATHLQGADFSGANLEKASFQGTKLREADFTGARFPKANLIRCDLEEMRLVGANFRGANLTNALLTGSVMPGADFFKANLRGTGLADVEWEGAILREADLRGATFHMGSSRSGLLFTPIASEGTRTGFYTDDYEEQHFKSPEEIRKANLCGADLRGARIDDVDFYLVDLRGAIFDPEQGRHFRRCGAILEDRN